MISYRRFRRIFALLLFWVILPVSGEAQLPSSVEKSADSLAVLCAEPLYNYNFESAQALLEDALKKNLYLRSLSIVDTLTGKEFVTARREEDASLGVTQSLSRTIFYQGDPIGELRVLYSSTLVTLSPAERRWILAHPVLRIGIVDWEPISMFKEGKASGIVGDYLRLISQRTGLKFQAVPLASWPEAAEALRKKSIHLLPAYGGGEDLGTHSAATRVYMRFPYVVVSRIKESFINSLQELRDKSVAVPRHSHSLAYLKKNYPGIHLIPTKNIIEALELVKEDKAFAFVGHMAVGMYYVGNFYANTLHISGKIDHTFEHRIYTHAEEKLLAGILDKALDSITPREHQQIKNRWLHIEVKEATDYTLIYTVGGIFSLLILISLYWNRKLSKEIDERKKIERKLARAKQEAERANSAKSIFLANMSHEIRTPMNAIVGFTELLNDEVRGPKLRSYVHNIQTASHTLLRLINDILDLSKIEAGKMELQYAPTDVARLCREIASIFELSAKKKGVKILLEVEENLPHVMADEIRLRQILLNLVGNAVKFTESGHVKISVHSRRRSEDPEHIDLIFAIEDTGIGIPEDQIETIFGAFEQTHGQDNRKYGGTGLGLSISKRLCEMMGGTIRAESRRGEGSTFYVRLPRLSIASLPSIEEENPAPLKAEQFDEAKILVVDDVTDNRELLVKIFEKSPLRTVTAKDGIEAVEVFQRERPDLVLMDLRMPRMDGYEAAKRIKEISPTTPIIALTASVTQDASQNEYFDGVLGKPIDREALFALLGRYLEYRSLKEKEKKKKSFSHWEEQAKSRLRSLLPAERSELLSAYRRAIENNSIPEIQAFAKTMLQIADRYAIDPLRELARELENALDSFDIARIEELLTEFKEIGGMEESS